MHPEEIPTYRGSPPWVTAEQMIEVDRAMIEDLGIELVQMMESAGRCLAHLARVVFLERIEGARVTVLAGPGGNGGGALVCARRLAAWGADVSASLSASEDRFAEVTSRQLAIARRMGIEIAPTGRGIDTRPELIIDGILGYGLRGDPDGQAARLIRRANGTGTPILALDLPSGLGASDGRIGDPTIRAAATLTLALPKVGLRAEGASSWVGELYLADIGVPPWLYPPSTPGLDVPAIFRAGDVVRLHGRTAP